MLATDFSDCSRGALESAAALASRLGASVHLLYVSFVPPQLVPDHVYFGDKFVDADIKQGRERLATALAELERSGVGECTSEVVAGYDAPSVILERARSGEFDLVVIGTHGRSGFKRRGSAASPSKWFDAVRSP